MVEYRHPAPQKSVPLSLFLPEMACWLAACPDPTVIEWAYELERCPGGVTARLEFDTTHLWKRPPAVPPETRELPLTQAQFEAIYGKDSFEAEQYQLGLVKVQVRLWPWGEKLKPFGPEHHPDRPTQPATATYSPLALSVIHSLCPESKGYNPTLQLIRVGTEEEFKRFQDERHARIIKERASWV